MHQSLITRYLQFVEDCEALEAILKLEFRIERAYKGDTPKEILDAIEEKKLNLNK